MAGIKIVCPHCTAILNSSKPVPEGKRVTCVKCKQPFAFEAEMMAASDTHHDDAFSLAESQPGTLKSPIASLMLPPITMPAPAEAACQPEIEDPAPASTDAESDDAMVPRPGARERGNASPAAFWATVGFVLLVLLMAGGIGLIAYLFSEGGAGPAARPLAEVSPTQDKPSPSPLPPAVDQKKRPAAAVARTAKKITPAAAVLAPSKADDKLPARIDEATRKGIQFLKRSIKPNGTWKEDTDTHSVGYAAMPGLALLECGVPAKDPVVQQAAAYIRARAPELKETYDIGAVILFLDALGEPADKKLIQYLALRLMAGQTPSGGWTYECPVINEDETIKLLAFLDSHKPEIKSLIPLPRPREAAREDPKRDREPGETSIRERPKEPAEKAKPVQNEITSRDREPAKTSTQERLKDTAKEPEKAKLSPETLPARLRELPIVAHQVGKLGYVESSSDDNSNTHFALLGLWAARRHDTPVGLSLGLTAERFQKTQARDGGWGYVVRSPPKNTMTCVGLVGLAMGHGAAAEIMAEAAAKNQVPAEKLARDPAIQDALKALGQYVDGDQSLRGLETRFDLYYLWCLERVGILYRQKALGKHDWFVYGANLILKRQHLEGHWKVHYDSPIDTAFALLFLNRSDLVEDLTHNLHTYLDIPLATPIQRERPREGTLRERERPRERLQETDIPRVREGK